MSTHKADPVAGKLAEVYQAAMQIWERMRADGVPFAERVRYLAGVLKSAWPKSREEPWHYVCERCDDTGIEMRECPGDATCGPRWNDETRHWDKPRRIPHAPHPYGVPCWCPKGARFRPAAAPTESDELAQVGKTSKSFTRAGR